MLMDPKQSCDPTAAVQDVRVLITAEEVYPAMEKAFLEAETEIWAGYRVFDLETKLRTNAGRAIGETWFDLIVHVLEKGVALNMVLSDFDPIVGSELHCHSWRARRAFIAAGELAGPDAKLNVVNAAHSSRVGLLPRLLLWPRMIKEVRRHAKDLNAAPTPARGRRLECSPGIRPWLTTEVGGRLTARKRRPPPLIPGTHHQKIAVFDRSLLCIGGLDLDERRYDDKGHHRRRDETWHDVQVMCRGSVAEDAQRHLESFLHVVAGTRKPEPGGALLRTLSKRRSIEAPFLSPQPLISELAEAHFDAIKRATDLIYLETQFFRDRGIADALANAANRKPDLGLILIVPGAPEDVAFDGATSSDARFGEYLQAKCVAQVSDAFEQRAAVCSPVRPITSSGSGRDTLCGSPIIYVHAKVSVFDEDKAIVSSANLNGRSLYWDTEAGVALERSREVSSLRARCFRHWLGDDVTSEFEANKTAAQAWHARAKKNADAAPHERKGFLVPHDPRPARAFGRYLPGMPDALV